MAERSGHFGVSVFRFPLFSVSNRAVNCGGRMNRGNVFAELKRRNVYKAAVAYIVAGWALAQGIAQVFPVFDIPNWVVRLIVLLIVLGFPVALALSWFFDLTRYGIVRTPDLGNRKIDIVQASDSKPTNSSERSIAVLPFSDL